MAGRLAEIKPAACCRPWSYSETEKQIEARERVDTGDASVTKGVAPPMMARSDGCDAKKKPPDQRRRSGGGTEN
jgi:hypothetical protein